MVSYRSPLLLGFLLTLSNLTAQEFERADYRAAALEAALACLRNAPQPSDRSPITISLHPAFIKADISSNSSSKKILPALEVLWSVSPNLGLLGGLGMAHRGGDLIRWQRWGLSFLAETLELVGFVPRFNFSQASLSGFASYDTKWNQIDWIYHRRFGLWDTQLGLTMLNLNVFLLADNLGEGISRRSDINDNYLVLAGGYNLFPWLKVDAFGTFGKAGTATGLQLNMAL